MSEPVRQVLLDSEPAHALAAVGHPKHQMVLAHVEAALDRGGRRRARPRVMLPTAVRVEAGIDRRAPSAAIFSRVRVADVPLDGGMADAAASINQQHAVGVADSHIAAAALSVAGPTLVLTSDPDDLARASAAGTDIDVRRI